MPTPLHAPAAFQKAIIAWFRREGRDYPWRRTADPYAILVSEMMLQQTQIATVLGKGYYERWMHSFPTPSALAAAEEPALLRAWEGLGYYNRARNLQRAARVICQEHDGKFPVSIADLERLPGLGRYTAGAVATFAFDLPVPIVDANIARVLARLFNFHDQIDVESGKRALWDWASRLVPRKEARLYNSGLMELGQRICAPQRPLCAHCPVSDHCAARDQKPERLPNKKAKRETVRLTEHAILAINAGRILLHLENGSRRQGLWKLPERSELELTESLAPLLLSTQYTITHHRVRLCVYEQPQPAIRADERWHALNALPDLPMPSPYRKALARLLPDS